MKVIKERTLRGEFELYVQIIKRSQSEDLTCRSHFGHITLHISLNVKDIMSRTPSQERTSCQGHRVEGKKKESLIFPDVLHYLNDV